MDPDEEKLRFSFCPKIQGADLKMLILDPDPDPDPGCGTFSTWDGEKKVVTFGYSEDTNGLKSRTY